MKDAYSLPRIDEDIRLFKWGPVVHITRSQVRLLAGIELDEESKALTAFTVGPLGFYQCEGMAFGLTNAPATFQRLNGILLRRYVL